MGNLAGKMGSTGYIKIGLDGVSYGAHRLAWLYTHGKWPYVVNHLNGCKMDNRIANLEDTDYSGNTLHAYRTGLISAPGARRLANPATPGSHQHD